MLTVDEKLLFPRKYDDNRWSFTLYIFLSHEKIPTFRSFDFHENVANLTLNNTLPDFEFRFWFLNNSLLLNRTGRWFMTVMELSEPLTDVRQIN